MCEETGENDEAEKHQRLSEEQLKMVEEIVKRYQQSQPKLKQNFMLVLLCLCCAAVALIVSVVSLNKANQLSHYGYDYDYQLSQLTSSNANIQSQLYDLSDRLNELAEGEKLLTEYTAEITALSDWQTAQIDFRAIPKTWQAGDMAYFSLRQEGIEQ